jgi:SulP family sulfate permease
MYLKFISKHMNVHNLGKDILAGLTTSFAAIALGAAFGIQSGRGALSGMIAAAIIPLVTSLFGGTRIQASGPTAPMTAVTVLVISYAYGTFGAESILAEQFVTLVIIMAGALSVISGLLRLGNLITLVPQVVVIGFMNGIAVLIWWDQIKKLFGLAGVQRLSGEVWYNVIFACATFLGIIFFPKILKLSGIPKKLHPFLPGTLVMMIGLTYVFFLSDLNLQTVSLGAGGMTLSGLLQLPYRFLPSMELLKIDIMLQALPFALQLCLLGYLDSLLTSLVVDIQTQETSKKNKELIAQGGANIISALFGGIPGAQATIRSILLLKEGAQTRFAGVMVGICTFLGIFIFQGALSLVATSIFTGVLIKAGWDVFETNYVVDFLTQKRYLDKTHLIQLGFVLYTTFITVLWDLNIAVISATIVFLIAKQRKLAVDIIEIKQSEDLSQEL